ncbi:helix-turn-helix domain-containing protein [Buttiauxella sp. B2]|uniref:helix-turn-helix domain-containing protein n=1 Tax=Buttiauxella sp. B2 TaxID=2587812 RepID=UPI001672B63C|nr:helix-turn-helix domain-containing protein [Buttiauxella sp. B2]
MKLSEKPIKSVLQLHEALSCPKRIVSIRPGNVVSFNSLAIPDCYFIHSGSANLRRAEDRKIICNIISPAIICLNDIIDLTSEVYIEAITPLDFEVLPYSEFIGNIERLNLWHPLNNILMYSLAKLFYLTHHLVVKNTKQVICWHLLTLFNEPDTIKNSTTVYDYIQQRTHISRSDIIKYLSEFRRKSMIKMDDDYLTSVAGLKKIN